VSIEKWAKENKVGKIICT